MQLPGRRGGSGGTPDWLIVGLGNPGAEYEHTPHNIGFEVARLLAERWQLPRFRARYRGQFSEGRTGVGPGHARVAMLLPQTYMNEAGRSVGPARGELRIELDRILVLHDEIDLPFGEVRARLGGGLAGHNGLKSLKAGLGSGDFRRVRIGVGRPPTTDPERVAAFVLGRFRESAAEVEELVDRAAAVTGEVVLGER